MAAHDHGYLTTGIIREQTNIVAHLVQPRDVRDAGTTHLAAPRWIATGPDFYTHYQHATHCAGNVSACSLPLGQASPAVAAGEMT